MKYTRILLVDDRPFHRSGVHGVVEQLEEAKMLRDADSGAKGIESYKEHSPDITLTGMVLPDMSGIELIKRLRDFDANAQVILISELSGTEYIYRAMEAGAMAYLPREARAADLLAAIRAVRQGKQFITPPATLALEERVQGNELTAREYQILNLLVPGRTNKEIGSELGIAEKTVRVHMSNILSKLGATDRTRAVVIALQDGFVDQPLRNR